MNSVNITGRLGQEIELRYTASGKAVTELNMAVDDGFGDNKKTAWIGVTIWDKTAEIAAKYLHKGDMVAITGRLSQEEWEKDGKKQRKTKVTCEQMTLLSNSQGDQRPAPAARQPAEKQRHEQAKADGFAPMDEDSSIPF